MLFNKSSKRPDGLQSWCRKCSAKSSARYYEANKAQHIKRVAQTKKDRAQQVLEYLSTQKCADCPESDPVVLEFDHVRGKKLMAVGAMVKNAFSWEAILKEIKKCEIRCANCHRRKTMKERKQFRWRHQALPELGR